MKRPLLISVAALLLSGSLHAAMHDPIAIEADPATATSPIAPQLDDLGDYSMQVTTSVAASQRFFDQGLRLTYGFNHSEALRAFKEAVRLDPDNAMAYWGWALVLGPNINLPMQPEVAEQAFAAIQKAIARKDKVSPREQAWIDALSERYAPVAPDNRRALDEAYASAMGELIRQYPDDLDALTLYGAALMNLSPWDYWQGDGQPKPTTVEIMRSFERVIAANPRHPGAIHYYIHTVEVAQPTKAESAADVLLDLMPGAGHMVHMPSHIYMRVGRYQDSYDANRRASDADAQYIAHCNAQGIYPLNYYPHNLHFLVWSAMFQGRSAAAMAGAREVENKIPAEFAQGSAEIFRSQPMYVMVRFGLWDQALAESQPADHLHFMNGVWHYMRGMAYTKTGKRRLAERELKSLQRLQKDLDDDYIVGFGTVTRLLTIAELVLSGEIDAGRKRYDQAIATLSRAVRLEDSLLYSEPPDWYFPTRHVLGAVLMDAGLPVEAATVYWQDLRKNPENGYSLFGLSRAFEATGDQSSAMQFQKRFAQAWSSADVDLTSSRF